jgi:hypothetical protein
MPEHDFPPVLDALGDDLAAAMQAAEAAAPRRRRLGPMRMPTAITRRVSRKWVGAFVAVVAVVAVAVAAILVVPSLGGSRTGLAQAAVLAHASAALEQQPNAILYENATAYVAGQTCLAVRGSAPPLCLGINQQNVTLSADPAQDTASYTYQEWISADGSQQHTIYNTGDETAVGNDTYSLYDHANNTITTDTGYALIPPPTAWAHPQPGEILLPSTLSVADLEALYGQATAGSPYVKLIGQTTIDGHTAYELQIASTPDGATSSTGATGATGATGVPGPTGFYLLLYIDSQSYLPLRAVNLSAGLNVPDAVNGVAVQSVTEFTPQLLPDTPANQNMLAISHPGAMQITTPLQAPHPQGARRRGHQ